MTTTYSRLAVVVAVCLLATGCAGQPVTSSVTSTASPTPSAAVTPFPSLATTTEEAETAPPGAVTIKLDGLTFVPDELTVKAGTVAFFLDTSAGLYPHNMLIGASPTEGPPLATSKTLPETQSMVFTVHDLPPGTYKFWCSLRDHVLAGMIGTLTVTD